MKIKTYFALLALLLCFGAAHAQKGWHYGLNGTYSATTIFDRENWGDVPYDYKYTSGYSVGFVGGWNFTEMLGVSGEVNYSWMGMRTHQDANINSEFDRDLRLQYIQIPIYLKATAGDFRNKFVAGVGPYVGFKTNAKLETSQRIIYTTVIGENGQPGQVATTIPANTRNIDGLIHNVDVGVIINAGGEFYVSEDMYMGIGMRALYGITNINKTNQILDPTSQRERLGNAALGINISINRMIRDK